MVYLRFRTSVAVGIFGCILHLTLSEESTSAKSNCSHEEECANTKDDESDDYVWGPWSSWSECSVTCGTGQRIRSRRCYHMTWPVPSKVDTQLCKQDAFDEKDCDMPLCKDDKAEKPNTYQENTGGAAGGATDDHVTSREALHQDDQQSCSYGDQDDAQYSADGMSGPDAMSGPDDDHHAGDRMSVDDEAGKASAEEGNQCRYRRNMKRDQQDNKERTKQDGSKQQNKKDGQSRQESNEGRRDNPRITREKSHEDTGQHSGPEVDEDADDDGAQTADDDQHEDQNERSQYKRRRKQLDEDDEIEEEEEEDKDDDEKEKKKKKRKKRRRQSGEKSSSSSSSEETSSYCTDSETESEDSEEEEEEETTTTTTPDSNFPVIDARRKQSLRLSGYEEDRESGDEIGELESPLVKFPDGQVPILTQTLVVTDNHQAAFIPSTETADEPATLVTKTTYHPTNKSTSGEDELTPTSTPTVNEPPHSATKKPFKLRLDLSPKFRHRSKYGAKVNGDDHSKETTNGAVILDSKGDQEKDNLLNNADIDVDDHDVVVETPKDDDDNEDIDVDGDFSANVCVTSSPSPESDLSGSVCKRCVSDSGHEGDISDVDLSEDPFSSTERLHSRRNTLDDEAECVAYASAQYCDNKDNGGRSGTTS